MEKTAKIESIIIDTGIVYALADAKDKWHGKAAEFTDSFRGKIIVPSPVIPEACYLLNSYLGQSAEAAFIKSLSERELVVEHFNPDDLTRASELLRKYGDSNIGFVDASLAAIAERLKICKILTTDRRHFSIIKPRHCREFDLLP